MGARALGRWLGGALLLWIAVVWPGRGWSQASVDATLRGEVRGLRGEAAPGTIVRLQSTQTGQKTFAVADGLGLFGFLGVVPGEYAVSIRLPMVPLWVGSGRIEVEAGAATDVTLRLAQGTDGLYVLRAGQGGSAVDENGMTVGVLPVPGREWEQVAEVSSAVRDGTLADGGSAQDATEAEESASAREARQTGMAASGLRLDGVPVVDSAESVDGLTADQGFRAGPRGTAAGASRAGSSFAQGAVGRLRVEARDYSALNGGSAGGGVRVASRGVEARSGPGLGTGLHGSAFFQAREAAWGAVNPYAVVTTMKAGQVQAARVRPADSELFFGAAAGRAVPVFGHADRGRLGVFGAVEARERRQDLFSSPETESFYELSATQRALLANRGVTSGEVAAALGYLSGMSGPEQMWGSQWLSFGRVDAMPGERDRLSLEYQGLRSATPVTGGGQVAEGVVDRAVGSVGTSAIRVDAGSLRWMHVLGPRWVNEMRVQLAEDDESETPGVGTGTGAGAARGFVGGLGGYPPQVTIGPQGFSYGTPASLGRVAYPDERRVEVLENSVWRFGRHLLTVGGSWSRVDDRVLGATNLQGAFLYDSGTTKGRAGGLVDWITDYTFNVNAYPNGGCPSITASVHYFCFRSYAQSFADVQAEFVTHEVAGFAEDAIRLRSNLRLSLGMRWEYELLPFPLAPNRVLDAALLDAGAAGSRAFGLTSSFPEDRNNVGPRVSLSWAPGASGVAGARRQGAWFTVQAGYGMFFGRLPGATLDAAITRTGTVQSVTSIRITPTVETACPQVANQGFGFPCWFPYAPAGVAAVAQTAATEVFARGFRLPVVQRASLGVEREWGRVRLRGEYATAWATQLPETTDLNVAPSTGTSSFVLQGGDGQRGLWSGQSFQVPVYTARLLPTFGPVTAIGSNANATFHSGTAEAAMRAWHGWGGRAGFTYSKAIDYGPMLGPTPRQDGQFDPFTNGYDKGTSSLDRPWQATGAVVYRSTWVGGDEWVRRLLGGWGASVIGRAGSGAPYSYVISGGTRLPGGYESINGSGGAAYLPTVGRNTLRLPRRSKVDLQASKEIGFGRHEGQRWRLQMRAEIFNVLNTVSLSRVETRAFLVGDAGSVGGMTPLFFQDAAAVASEGLSTPAFGTGLSSTSGLSRERTVELGARLQF